jgi:hypothetical protein
LLRKTTAKASTLFLRVSDQVKQQNSKISAGWLTMSNLSQYVIGFKRVWRIWWKVLNIPKNRQKAIFYLRFRPKRYILTNIQANWCGQAPFAKSRVGPLFV